MRIVSLVPSLTKTIVDFGLKDQIVGCTTFCVDPPDLHRSSTLVGGTKDPDLARIESLKPTHILVNEEENRKEDVETLQKIAQVLNTFPKSPTDVPAMLRSMGGFLDVVPKAEEYAKQLEIYLARLSQKKPQHERFYYLIWMNPVMAAGKDTYISRLMELTGMQNALTNETTRYPELQKEDFESDKPDKIFLSSEPFPFKKRHIAMLREQWGDLPEVELIDGKLCSWYGTLTVEAFKYLMLNIRPN